MSEPQDRQPGDVERGASLDEILPGLRPQPELKLFRTSEAGDLEVWEIPPAPSDGAPRLRARFPSGGETDAKRFVKAETMQTILARELACLRGLLAETGMVKETGYYDATTPEGKLRRLVANLGSVQEGLADGAACTQWVEVEDGPPPSA